MAQSKGREAIMISANRQPRSAISFVASLHPRARLLVVSSFVAVSQLSIHIAIVTLRSLPTSLLYVGCSQSIDTPRGSSRAPCPRSSSILNNWSRSLFNVNSFIEHLWAYITSLQPVLAVRIPSSSHGVQRDLNRCAERPGAGPEYSGGG
jgi:hypothetical protein